MMDLCPLAGGAAPCPAAAPHRPSQFTSQHKTRSCLFEFSSKLCLWEVIAASTDTCEPRKYPDAERRRDTYAAHKYPEMRQLLPISALIVPLVH